MFLLLFCTTSIRGKVFYCFSDHFFYPSFLASLHILPNSITPPSPTNHPYFQTPPSVIISFLSPLIALPLFLLFLPPPFLTSYLISVHFCSPPPPTLSLPLFLFSLLCLSLLNGSSDPITERRCCRAAEEEEAREGGAGGGVDGRMDCVLCVWMGWLMSIASRGCYPCSGPAGTPMGHLWSQARGCDTHTAHTEAGTLCKQTRIHTPRKPITADIIINNGGTMGSGATIANTTQSLRVLIVHERVVSQLQCCCCCWDRFSSQVANSLLSIHLQHGIDLTWWIEYTLNLNIEVVMLNVQFVVS